MFNLNGNSVKIYDRSIPKVRFDKEDIQLYLDSLFKPKNNIYYYLGLIFLRLGYEPENNIFLCNYNKDESSFDCIVNDYDRCSIRIQNVNNGDMEIVLNRCNTEFGYLCEYSSVSEVGMNIYLGRYSIRHPEGIIFTRCFSRNNAKFVVDFGNYILELELEKPSDLNLPLYDNNGRYAKYRLDNEEKLVAYLVGLNGEIAITDIYKELCERYLSDIYNYPRFSLNRSRITEGGKLKVTDLISLNNGKMDKFGVTEKGITVFLDKDDNWLFEMPSGIDFLVNFCISNQDGKVICMFSASKEYDLKEYTNKMIFSNINDAYDEVLKVKKRIRGLFKNIEGSK